MDSTPDGERERVVRTLLRRQGPFYRPTLESLRKQSSTNCQGGTEPIDAMTAEEFNRYLDSVKAHYGDYERMLEKEGTRELAHICQASANRRRQHGHSPSCPLMSDENAVGCGMVMIALNANGARCA